MKTLKIIEMVVALLMVSALVLPVFTVNPVKAVQVTIPPGANDPIVWSTGANAGTVAYATMSWNPEWLKLRTETAVQTSTEVVVQGLDQYGANIEAKVIVTPSDITQRTFIFNDSQSGEPVTFTKITGIYQQGGTHSNSFGIWTEPIPYEQYLGQYEASIGYWQPGRMDNNYPNVPANEYLFTSGAAALGGPYPAPGLQDVPVEPFNPEPVKILINWNDAYTVLQPIYGGTNEWPNGGATSASVIYIEGLNQAGQKLIVAVNVKVGDTSITVDTTNSNIGLNTFSTICKVWGGFKGDSYYFLTEPMVQRELFEYFIRINHITLYPASYDILAYPGIFDGGYPGVTTITAVLKDIDDHVVYFGPSDNWANTSTPQPIVVNWWTSGGVIHPSTSYIYSGDAAVTVNITADTNPRTIQVVADANIPAHTINAPIPAPEMNLMAWTEMVFDGVNSVLDTSGWPIHTLLMGYTDSLGNSYTMNAPPRPPLWTSLGGPDDTLTPPWKLDGPIYEVSIPLYSGCNLISSPVYPFLLGIDSAYMSASYGGLGIPMVLLFSHTDALETIQAVWWYTGTGFPESLDNWNTFIPGVTDTPAYFTDGVGYWIKAEKPCTLELSGVQMENAPFIPAQYEVFPSWNLMGFTSITQLATSSYLESLSTGYVGTGVPLTIASSVGPVWTWDAHAQSWSRDPDMLWPGQGFWMNYKLLTPAFLSP